ESAMRQDFYLTDEQRSMRDLVRSVARDRIAPLAAHVDAAEPLPAEQLELLGKQGLMGLYIPEAYGGSAMGALAFCIAVEEIAWACASTAVIYLVPYAGGWPIVAAGNEEQKRRYLPRLASGEITAAFSVSEPGAGSDAASLATLAVRKGDRYVLNGQKLWVSNGSQAKVITLFATVDRGRGGRGVTAFLVEPTFPGFSVGKLERKMGIRGSPTVALHLTDCEVPVENRLGEEGEGFKIALRTLDGSPPPLGGPGGGHGPGGARRGGAVREGAPAVRSADRLLSGPPVHVGRHGDAGPRCAAPRPSRRVAPRPGGLAAVPGAVEAQVLRGRRGHEGRERRGTDLRRLRLHARISGRTLHARREDHADLRGYEPDPARRHRPRAHRPVAARPSAPPPAAAPEIWRRGDTG